MLLLGWKCNSVLSYFRTFVANASQKSPSASSRKLAIGGFTAAKKRQRNLMESNQSTESCIQPETPENGLKGLKHWRQDMFAGFIIALVSVPLSLGIALASGAPPICGITSEIIAGLVFPFLGGAYVTISGPAAGLAPVLYSSISALGHGNMEVGYRLVLGVIMFAAVTQLVLTYFKAAKFSYLFPKSAVNGMLAAIGLLIIAKQIPHFIGHKYHAHEFFTIISETPSHIFHLNPAVFFTSIVCLALLFILPKTKIQWLRYIPPHLIVVLTGIGLGQLLHLAPNFLVEIPANPLEHGIVFPDFQGLFNNPGLIPTIVFSVLALTFVDGTESLATIHAVDQIDPYSRKSNPHRTLFAMGISNICSSLIGGLTIIPGIIKSTTCIVAGGRTAWANFYNAVFLIAFLLIFNNLIALIPIAALSAVLVHIGYKLAGPHKWQQVYNIGWDQVAVFTTTVLVTVFSDLLIGIACGIAVKVLILLFYAMRCDCRAAQNPGEYASKAMHCLASLFKNPVGHVTRNGSEAQVIFTGPVTCFNNLKVRGAIDPLLKSFETVHMVLSPSVGIVDHSSTSYLNLLVKDRNRNGLAEVTVEGLDDLCCKESDKTSLHFRYRTN